MTWKQILATAIEAATFGVGAFLMAQQQPAQAGIVLMPALVPQFPETPRQARLREVRPSQQRGRDTRVGSSRSRLRRVIRV